jgi:hypothetical protein
VKADLYICSTLNKIPDMCIIPISTYFFCFLLIAKVPRNSYVLYPKYFRVREYLTGTKVLKDQGEIAVFNMFSENTDCTNS